MKKLTYIILAISFVFMANAETELAEIKQTLQELKDVTADAAKFQEDLGFELLAFTEEAADKVPQLEAAIADLSQKMNAVEQHMDMITDITWWRQLRTITTTMQTVLKRGPTLEESDRWWAMYKAGTFNYKDWYTEIANHPDFINPMYPDRQPTPTPPTSDKANALYDEPQISGFLYDSKFVYPDRPSWVGDSSMILLSPYVSDATKKRIIDTAADQGMNRIHFYTINDENYSGSKTNAASVDWKNAPYRPIFGKFAGIALPSDITMPSLWQNRTVEQQQAHWIHWMVYAKTKGLNVTVWLWCNQATNNFNNTEVWDDAKVLAYNKAVIEQVCNYRWNGTDAVVDEIVLKLEADDEWSERSDTTNPGRRDNVDILNRRAEQHYKMIAELGGGQTVWYHNEATNEASTGFVWDMLDWRWFDGIRLQLGFASESPTDVVAAAKRVLVDVPTDKLIYVSEYTTKSYSLPEIGEALLEELTPIYGDRLIGVDNGGK